MEGFSAPKKREFIPGRPEGEPVVEREFTPNGAGGVHIDEQRYRLRAGEYASEPRSLSTTELDELQTAGLKDRTEIIDQTHAAHDTLVQILKRSSIPETGGVAAETPPAKPGRDVLPAEVDPEKMTDEELKDGIEKLKALRAKLEEGNEEKIKENAKLQAELMKKLSEKLGIAPGTDLQEVLRQLGVLLPGEVLPVSTSEATPTSESTKDSEPDEPKPDDTKKTDEPKEGGKTVEAKKSEGHGHDDHGHHGSWHFPRTPSEIGWFLAAVGLGTWYAAKFFLKNVGHPILHTLGYIISGDTKHPWQTLFKRTGTIFETAFKGFLGKKGGSHGGGGHGHGGGGGHGHGH